MKMKHWILILFMLGACTDKYVANIKGQATGFLVVEGFINISGTTNIQMSRSTGLDSPAVIPETGAHVEIQSTNGSSILLSELTTGNYSDTGLNLDPIQQYRLHINTSNGKDYLSDLSSVNISPPIDSLNWKADSNGVTIYVTTHNPLVQPGYYQWSYEETWKYNSRYPSSLEYMGGCCIPRPDSDMFFTCWRSDVSTTINIASTEKLTSNVIYQYPVALIPYDNTNKLIDEYSILVKQTVLSQDWYEWIQKLQRNTEQLGSIFDALPTETGGNIHNTADPTEQVIGFIGTSTETEKRIFISRTQIQPPTVVYSGYESCELDSTNVDPALEDQFAIGNDIPLYNIFEGGNIVGVTGSVKICVDCRLKGGTLIQPDFWQ
jgi:Domain of unknown function (DUF4249)